MPFDPAGYNPAPDLTELQPGHEGLRQLSYLLRHPEEWQRGFEWDFDTRLQGEDCHAYGCALGIADLQWPSAQVGDFQTSLFCNPAWDIFFNPSVYGTKHRADVTPTMVADAIDFYLREGRVPVNGEASG